jgi:tRNA(Ile)-lysidine synthase
VNLLKSESGKYISSPTHRIIKNRDWLIIAPINSKEAHYIIIEESDETVDYENGVLTFKKLKSAPKEIFQNSTDSVIIDSAKLEFPIILRKWKQGDYFYPLGMPKKSNGKPGKKKLSKFFVDQKISLSEKETIWVLESNKRIVWIINKRLDERFKVTAQTKTFLSIKFNGSEKYPLG